MIARSGSWRSWTAAPERASSIAPRTNFRGHQVIEELDRLARVRGKPEAQAKSGVTSEWDKVIHAPGQLRWGRPRFNCLFRDQQDNSSSTLITT